MIRELRCPGCRRTLPESAFGTPPDLGGLCARCADFRRRATTGGPPAKPASTGTLAQVAPGAAPLPSAGRDVWPGTAMRVFWALLLLVTAAGVLSSVLAEREEGRYLLQHGVEHAATVARVWETPGGRTGPTTHIAVRLDVDSATGELVRWSGDPAVGARLTVLEDPRGGQLWERSAAVSASHPPAWLLTLPIVATAAAVPLTCWLASWPLRLRRTFTRSSRLACVRGEVTRVRRTGRPSREPKAWAIDVRDPAGGHWSVRLSRRSGVAMDADAQALLGRVVRVVLLGDRMKPGAGALLVADSPLPSGRRVRWFLRYPETLAAADLPSGRPGVAAAR